MQQSLRDQRAGNKGAGLVPAELLEVIHNYLLRLIAAQVEIDSHLLQPHVLALIQACHGGKYASVALGERAFKASRSWIRAQLRLLNQAYRKEPNSAGKLPDTWEADQEAMLIRIAYLVKTHRIPKCFLVNMDETPGMVLPRRG